MTDERDAVLQALPEADVTVYDLARAFVRPVVAAGGEHWIRLVGLMLASGDEGLTTISASFVQRNASFVGLLERLTPEVPRRTLDFRLTQAMNVTLNVLGDVERARRLQGVDAVAWTADEVVADLVELVTSMLAGPASPDNR